MLEREIPSSMIPDLDRRHPASPFLDCILPAMTRQPEQRLRTEAEDKAGLRRNDVPFDGRVASFDLDLFRLAVLGRAGAHHVTETHFLLQVVAHIIKQNVPDLT